MTDPHNASAHRLSRLMDDHELVKPSWAAEELAAMASHQLDASLARDLDATAPDIAGRLSEWANASGGPIKTFRDLFAHPAPPLELLETVKDFAKRAPDHPEAPLPREIAGMLYYTSIAAAHVRCDRRITTLDVDALRSGLQWLLQQAWLADAIAELLMQYLARLEAERTNLESR